MMIGGSCQRVGAGTPKGPPAPTRCHPPLLLFLFLVIVFACAQSPADPASRVHRLGEMIRCPVCRGVPIADSPSEIAGEMMQIVQTQVAEGKTDEEILKYFEERYGEWAILQPKAEGMNLTVWVLPALFIIGGGGFILYQVKKEKP